MNAKLVQNENQASQTIYLDAREIFVTCDFIPDDDTTPASAIDADLANKCFI